MTAPTDLRPPPELDPPTGPARSRWLVVVALLALVAASLGYVRFTRAREAEKAERAATESGLPEPNAGARPSTANDEPIGTAAPSSPLAPAMLTVNRSPGDRYGTLARIGPDGAVTPFADLTCERVHLGTHLGACLVPTPQQVGGELNLTIEGTELVLFDPVTGQRRGAHPVAGRPSRMRMSLDDRYVGYTAFVTGHSYAVASSMFSTNPVIVDTVSGVHHWVETFEVVDQDGRLVDDPTRNYWGITFSPTDSDTFYVALGIGEQNWVVEGSVTQQRGRIIAEGLMCPSASPDGRYLVARDRTQDSRYAIHDLEAGTHRLLEEERVVDDQVEWLDADTVAYAVLRDDGPANQPVYDVWALDVETGATWELAVAASSPAIVHTEEARR